MFHNKNKKRGITFANDKVKDCMSKLKFVLLLRKKRAIRVVKDFRVCLSIRTVWAMLY